MGMIRVVQFVRSNFERAAAQNGCYTFLGMIDTGTWYMRRIIISKTVAWSYLGMQINIDSSCSKVPLVASSKSQIESKRIVFQYFIMYIQTAITVMIML